MQCVASIVGDLCDTSKRQTVIDSSATNKAEVKSVNIFVIYRTIRLTPALVEQDVNLLKEFCGDDEDQHVLEEIAFTSEHKFQNGCRSPPWRQVNGDICYIEVKPHDEDPFFVTASTMGYFVNKVRTRN